MHFRFYFHKQRIFKDIKNEHQTHRKKTLPKHNQYSAISWNITADTQQKNHFWNHYTWFRLGFEKQLDIEALTMGKRESVVSLDEVSQVCQSGMLRSHYFVADGSDPVDLTLNNVTFL